MFATLARDPDMLRGIETSLQTRCLLLKLWKQQDFIALQQWGQQIAHTCKASTRKDYCYISRELQGLLQRVHVADDIFADHAVIWGIFNSMTQVLPR